MLHKLKNLTTTQESQLSLALLKIASKERFPANQKYLNWKVFFSLSSNHDATSDSKVISWAFSDIEI